MSPRTLFRRAQRRFAVIGSCLALVACAEEGSSARDLDVLLARDFGVGCSAGWQPLYSGSEFIQGVRYGGDDPDEAGDGGDPQIVDLIHRYLVLGQREWDDHWYRYSASFDVARISSSQRNVLFLTGVASDGEAVIERWVVSPTSGPEGQEDRALPPSIAREQVYRGRSLGAIRELGPDPEGRFVLALCSASGLSGTLPRPWTSSELWQVDLAPGYALTKVLAGAQEASLDAVDAMLVMQHETEGRVWILESVLGFPRTILYDADNDGTLENWAGSSSAADWVARGYDGDVWLDDFHSDWYWQ